MGVKDNAHGAIPAQPFRHQRNVLGAKEVTHKPGIQVADRGGLKDREHVAGAEGFGDKTATVRAQLHERVNQQLHGVNAAARTALAIRARTGNENVIHAAGLGNGIPEADGDTGTENRVQPQRMAAGHDIADVDPPLRLMVGAQKAGPGGMRNGSRPAARFRSGPGQSHCGALLRR